MIFIRIDCRRASGDGELYAPCFCGGHLGLNLQSEEYFRIDACLLQDGSEGSFRHIAGMVRNSGVLVPAWMEPDLMTSCGMAVEHKTAGLEPSDYLSVAEPGQAAHLCRHHDGVVLPLGSSGQRRSSLPFPAGFDELSGHIPRDIEGFRHSPALGHQTRQLLGRRQVQAFRKFLDLDLNRQLHASHIVSSEPLPKHGASRRATAASGLAQPRRGGRSI